MQTRKNVWRTGFAGIVLAAAALAAAQVAGDFPTLKGNNARTGHNGAPNSTGPGRSLLHWFEPNRASDLANVIIDNTDMPNNEVLFPGQGPFDPTLFGSTFTASPYVPPAGGLTNNSWASIPIDGEAANPFILPVRRGNVTGAGGVVHGPNYNSRFPAYILTNVTPSAQDSPPTVAATPADRRFARWFVRGASGTPTSYALYVWLPDGPSQLSGVTVYPQRYYVYEIRYGQNLNNSYIDVVDTYASGGGWVRLGNGGAPTNRVFPWDGTNQITVTLWNTVPRDGAGRLTMPHAPGNENDVKRFVVYADALRALPVSGSFTATPISARLDPLDAASQLLISAKNEVSVAGSDNTPTVNRGRVTTYNYDSATKLWMPRWNFAPSEQTSQTTQVDNTSAAVSGDFVPNTTVTRFAGADALVAPIQNTTTGAALYQPTLNEGTYEVYAYIPGDNNGVQFGREVEYEIFADGQTYVYKVDQSRAQGWIRIGDRRFRHRNSVRLRVQVTNRSAAPTDLTRNAYADAIRFVGEQNLAVHSTPVYATANIMKGGVLTPTKVVIVADETGRIHCLDAEGNGDGTTTEYWAYPSLRTPDPNHTASEDGVGGLAEMPTGFDLSTAVVQNVGGTDFLYIASLNGRVYCIEMAGRGDYTLRTPGTTRRRWTYPHTYPTPSPIPRSSLGAFRGSLVFANTSSGPTIFVPTTQGRLYALDALGTGNKATNVRWAFPQLNQPTLGEIWMTPSYFELVAGLNTTGRVFFGTLRKDDTPGRFFSLNAATGAVEWELNPGLRLADDFLSSPAVVSYKTLADSALAPDGGVVYTLNQNRVFYAIDAASGAILWQTDELGTGARASLTYTTQLAFNNLGIPEQFPVIVVPTADGRLTSLYANPDPNFTNRFGTKRAWEYEVEGDTLVASASNAHGWMFAGDSTGFLYAFTNTDGSFGPGSPQPGRQTVVENDPAGDIFRKAKVRLITRSAFRRLRLPSTDPNRLSYQEALDASNSFVRNPLAFEWGETIYVLVYDFPFRTTNTAGNLVPPPVVRVSFNVDGKTVRGQNAEARQFRMPPNPPKLSEVEPNVGQPPPPDGDTLLDGYAILSFAFNSGGSNSLPPGDAELTFRIETQSLRAGGPSQPIAGDPRYSRLPFKMAHPIALSTKPGVANATIGLDTNPSGQERMLNGSPAVGAIRKDLIGTSTGWAQHGQTKDTTLYVYDTSMMGLLRPDGMGLDGVRFDRRDLARQGGAAAVYKPLNPTRYPNFEDYPVNYPNTSLDYPDIDRESIRITKDPAGNPENPLFNGVQLYAPLVSDPGAPGGVRRMREGDRPEDRVFRPTPVQVNVDVPRFQPPVDLSKNPAAAVPDSTGATWNTGYVQGYIARLNVFVDSFQNGNLDVTQREAYRAFNLATAVAPDERLAVTTPSVDLGSLPTGAGFSSATPPGNGGATWTDTTANLLSPWGGRYRDMYKEFTVQNLGNVNMLNLRVAKADQLTSSTKPWFLASAANDPLAWLEAGWPTNAGNLYSGLIWSDLDWQQSPWSPSANADRNVILQKARVTDRVPTDLAVNPRRRTNANLGVTEGNLLNTTNFPARAPRITASVPIGFPSGRYSQRMRIIENTDGPSQDLFPTWTLSGAVPEPASDPTFDLLFTVREARLTNSFTPFTDRMIDNPVTIPANQTRVENHQPAIVRDAFGSLVLAWASNRPSWDAIGVASAASTWRIYLATLDNAWTFTPGNMTGPNNQAPTAPLRDLNNWNPSTGRWWRREIENFPSTNPNTLFQVQAGESLIASTVRYGSPSFPGTGMTNPFDPSTIYQGMYMAFVGEAQKSTPTGRIDESRIMAAVITPNANGGLTADEPIVMRNDPTLRKGKPSIVQTPTGAMVFYAGIAGGQSRIYYSRLGDFGGTFGFGPSTALPFGNGFEALSSPSAAGRRYLGANTENGGSVIEMSFAGKLRGRPNTEVFMGRLKAVNASGTGGANADRLLENADGSVDVQNAFVWLPLQQNERLLPENGGVYRTRGVVWNLDRPVRLEQTVPGGTPMNLLLDGYDTSGNYVPANDTRRYDRATGLLSYDTRLGGKVYIDPSLGTVRFTGGLPPRNADLRATYQPRFVRVTPNATAGYAGPTGLFDGRLISDLSYWRRPDGSVAQPSDTIPNDRFVYTYNRAAAGTGQAARPYVSTLRFGVRLRYQIATDNDGVPLNLQVLGNTGPYQLDPSQGKVYFTAQDEDKVVRITYTGMDEAGNLFTNVVHTGVVTLVGERSDEPIPVEQAVNESALSTFLDPINIPSMRRPPLIWLVWTSTRSGSADLFFQTIAPNWSPIPLRR